MSGQGLREALERTVRGAWDNSKFPDEITNDIVNAVLALLGPTSTFSEGASGDGSVLAGEREQEEREK